MSQQARPKHPFLSDKDRFLIGAIGGILVGILGYSRPSYKAIFSGDPDVVWAASGWVAQAVFFSALGGLWAYLHRSEHERLHLFEFGILGPAVISAMVIDNLPKDVGPIETPPAAHQPKEDGAIETSPAVFGLVKRAYAQKADSPVTVRPFLRDFWRGFTGTALRDLTMTVQTEPPSVSPGEKTLIRVTVQDRDRPVSGAQVQVLAGGGTFTGSNTTAVVGETDSDGVFLATWSCETCAPGYGFSISVSKTGFETRQGVAQVSIK